MRRFLLALHRKLGLLLVVYAILAGATGTLLAYKHELDRWLNPEIFNTGEPATLSLAELAAAAERAYPQARATTLFLPQHPGYPAAVKLGRKPGNKADATPLPDEVLIAPASGRALGARSWQHFAFDRAHVVPFLHVLHVDLLLGKPGLTAVGILGILWLIDTLVATFGSLRRNALKVRFDRGRARLYWDLHVAGGLLTAALLVMLAITGALMCFRPEARALVGSFAPLTPTIMDHSAKLPRLPEPVPPAWDDAAAAIRATRPDLQLSAVRCERATGACEARMRHPDDPIAAGSVRVLLGPDRRVIHLQDTLSGTPADLLFGWLYPLHTGRVFGLAGATVIALSGVAAVMLSFTGLLLWTRKLAARRRQRRVPERGAVVAGVAR